MSVLLKNRNGEYVNASNDKYANYYNSTNKNSIDFIDKNVPPGSFNSSISGPEKNWEEWGRRNKTIPEQIEKIKRIAKYQDDQYILSHTRQNFDGKIKADYDDRLINTNAIPKMHPNNPNDAYIIDGYDYNNPDRVRGPPLNIGFRSLYSEQQDDSVERHNKRVRVFLPSDIEVKQYSKK